MVGGYLGILHFWLLKQYDVGNVNNLKDKKVVHEKKKNRILNFVCYQITCFAVRINSFPWLATKYIIDAAYYIKPRRQYLVATAISTSNVLPRNYRTKVSWYNEFYRGITRLCRINAIVHDLVNAAILGGFYRLVTMCTWPCASCKFAHIVLLTHRVS